MTLLPPLSEFYVLFVRKFEVFFYPSCPPSVRTSYMEAPQEFASNLIRLWWQISCLVAWKSGKLFLKLMSALKGRSMQRNTDVASPAAIFQRTYLQFLGRGPSGRQYFTMCFVAQVEMFCFLWKFWCLLHKIVRFETYLPVGMFPGGRYV